MIFQKKCFSCYFLLSDQIPLSGYFYILGNLLIAVACFPGFDVIDFEINLIFLINPFTSQDKNLDILRMK